MFANAPLALNEPECWSCSSLKTRVNGGSPKSTPLTSNTGVMRTCGRMTAYVASMRSRSMTAVTPSLAEVVPGEPRHPADELIRGGETRRAVRQRLRHVLRVRGEDVERRAVLEDDAGVHEATAPRARLVRDLRPERELRRQARLQLLPAQDIDGELAERRRRSSRSGRRSRTRRDRKSTRLNSSHTVISYAVFCLKKKK